MIEQPFVVDEYRELREQVRRFVRAEITPYGDAWEKAGRVPRELLLKMGELGLLGLRAPERFGGSGLGVLGWVVLAEELGRSTYGGVTVVAMVHSAMAMPHLFHAGTEEQMARWLPDLIAGRKTCCIAVSEADAGSDVSAIRTTARRDGDDWVLNGAKFYISNAVFGEVFFVAARTDPDAKGARGLSMFAVEKGDPGFSVGRRLEKFGDWCADTAEIILDEVRLPADRLLGEEGRGFYAAMKNFQGERLVLGAMASGEGATALKLTIDHLRNRKAFGAPLIEKQGLRQRLAMHHAKLEAGRQLLYYAAWLEEQGLPCIREVSMVKAFCAETCNELMYSCQQFHGGMGYLRETAIERMVRDARLHAIGGGATEVMLEEIAKRWDDVPYWQ